MPTDSSSRKPAPRRLRRWLRIGLALFLAATVAVAASLYYAMRHLPLLAKWALERTFPGAAVEIRKLEIGFPNRLTAESITLKSRKDGATLLTLAGGSVTFNFSELRRRQISEVRLTEPVINASPRFPEALAAPPGSKAKAGPPWTVRRLVCDYGQLNVAGYGPPGLTIQSKFRFDFKDFSTAMAPAEPHELVLWDLTAAAHADPAFLRLDLVRVKFDLNDLVHGQIREVRLVEPVITVSPQFTGALAVPSGSEATAGAAWTVRRLVCDYGQLTVTGFGAPKLAIQSKFCFDFKDFSTAISPAELHELVLWDLTAATDADPAFLSLDLVRVKFDLNDLVHRQIGEVRLVEPVISVSPRFTEALAAPSGSEATAGAPWTVRRLVCDYGQLNATDFGAPKLAVQSKFCFDFKDFSTATTPAELHEFVFWDLTAAAHADPAFLRLDLVRARFNLEGLVKDQAIAALLLEGGSLVFGKSLREIFSGPTEDSSQTSTAASSWTLRSLDIKRVAVRVDDERPQVSDITFALNSSLKNVPLSKSASALGAEQQSVEIANLEVLSPLDPFTKVLTLDSIFVRFTLAGLLRREIEALTILGPNIFLGEDLFWYMDDMQKRLGTAGEADTGPGWIVKHLSVEYGRLTLGSGGRRQYGLPLSFRTRAQDVALDNLAALKLQAVLEIPPQEYVFDSYQLEFTSERGELRFSYPPEKRLNNLVGVIRLKTIRWRQYRASDSYISVTFDRNGINGQFGGKVYRGETWGGFSFFFAADSPWIGWLSGRGISLRQLTNIISPENFELSGPLEFRLQMDAKRRDIQRVLGDFRATRQGKMVIHKIDDLLARIPSTWNLTKQSSTRIALETLRDFDYTTAGGDFWFVESQGVLRLKLKGPAGSRNFEVVLHADESSQGRWKRSANR